MQNQHARSRRIVQLLPGHLDLLQLAENLVPEGLNSVVVAGFGRVRSKLAVQLLPSETLRSTECERPVDKPEVEIEAQGGAFEGLQDVHVNRHRVVDDLVEEHLT